MQGAFGLLRRDPAALLAFDNTMEACLRSFRVMAVTAPIYAIYALIHYAGTTVAIEPVEVFVVEAMSYVIQWLLYPVIFHEVARRRGWLDRYPRYIGALNWTNLPAIAHRHDGHRAQGDGAGGRRRRHRRSPRRPCSSTGSW